MLPPPDLCGWQYLASVVVEGLRRQRVQLVYGFMIQFVIIFMVLYLNNYLSHHVNIYMILCVDYMLTTNVKKCQLMLQIFMLVGL